MYFHFISSTATEGTAIAEALGGLAVLTVQENEREVI